MNRIKKQVKDKKIVIKEDKEMIKSLKDKSKSKPKDKMKKVIREFSEGELHSGSKKGPKVKSKAQALAIAYSEAKRARKKKK